MHLKFNITGGRHVGFLQGSDGREWVWIMGEHKDDKSLEQILEEEAQENARLLAEREAEALRSDASFHCYWKHIAVNCREISV